MASACRLRVELVPHGAWYKNVRAVVSKADWDRLRRETYRHAAYRCEICGGQGTTYPVACHEVWAYDERSRRQWLVRLTALCPACHDVQHLGRTGAVGGLQAVEEATVHLCRVNSWTREQADRHVEEAFATWRRRSRIVWTQDYSWLKHKRVAFGEGNA